MLLRVRTLATTIIIRHGCYIRTFERRVNRSFISKDNRCFSIFLPLSVFLAGFALLLPSPPTHFKSNKWNPCVELTSIIRINSTVIEKTVKMSSKKINSLLDVEIKKINAISKSITLLLLTELNEVY